uniref:GH3 domain-containing protein n=1 Tax=Arion vulgaris TaxID=1028688 RepID=A0A0B6YSS8_9EUPU
MEIIEKIFMGITAVGMAGVSYVVWDIKRHTVYSNQSFKDAAKHYIAIRSLVNIGIYMKYRLEQATKNVEKTQTEFLMRQIKCNLNTEYSKDMGLTSVKTRDDFLRIHRLTCYSDYSRYIHRMISGEKKVLTSADPIVFAVTSGTSGQSNIIPMVRKQSKLFFLEGISVLFKSMVDTFPATKLLNKDFKIFYNPNWRYSVDNTPVGPNSASPDRSKSFLHMYTTPPPAYMVRSEPEALYLYLLFALLDPHLGMIEANFSSIIFNTLFMLEDRLSELVRDIETGQIDPDLNIDPSVREQLSLLISPNPQRAHDIREAAKKGKEGLALRIWPELHIAMGADTGTFDLYADKLRSGYLKGVPLYSPIYAASEGLLGINIWPNQHPTRYLLHPRTQFFEFIPDDLMDQDQPNTLLLHQVKEGSIYELVITNPSCLYRYRFGDVVRVVGFHNQCPIVEFMYRKGQILNVRGEKMSEAVFYEALKDTQSEIFGDDKLVDYCCMESILLDGMDVSEDLKSSKPCYHVFVELEDDDKATVQSFIPKLQKELDTRLQDLSYPYSSFRSKGSIDLLQVHLVKKGSFSLMRLFMLEQKQVASNQYKVPRVLRKQEAVKFMLDKIVK